MLSTTAIFRDLPLRANGFAAFDGTGDALRIVTLAEPVEPEVKIASLTAAIFDDDGKSISHWSATNEELQRSPIIGAMPHNRAAIACASRRSTRPAAPVRWTMK